MIKIEVGLVVQCDDDASLDEFISELDYDFTDRTGKAKVVDTELLDWEKVNNE